MSRRRNGGAVRGPASALTSFLAGLGVEPSARLTTWGDNSLIPAGGEETQPTLAHDGPVIDDDNLDPAGAVTARTVEAGPSQVGDGPVNENQGTSERSDSPAPPSKRKRGLSIDSEDLDNESPQHSGTVTPADLKVKVSKGPLKAVGQFMKCGECTKRFTVTPYTKEHPKITSTWLCVPCCYSLGIDPFEKAKKASKKKAPVKEDRAKIVHYEQKKGAPTLNDICIELIGKHIENVEELGDIGLINLDKVCRIISKSRKLTPETAPLFYSGDRKDLAMYDCTNLVHSSYVAMSHLCPELERLHLHLCGQLSTDSVITLGNNLKHLRRLEVFAPFLVRKEGWIKFFQSRGLDLEGFLLTQSPRIDFETIQAMVECCPRLTELRLSEVEKLDDACLGTIGNLTHLEHLDISSAGTNLTDQAVGTLLQHVGNHLVSLNLSNNMELTDVTLVSIAKYCPRLRKLQLANLVELTDDGVAGFFRAMKTNQGSGLEIIDMEKGHDLGDKAVKSLVESSSTTLRELNILGWREASAGALSGLAACDQLQRLDIGWCRKATDFVLKDIIDGCPEIRNINVWGCNQLTDSAPRKKGVKIVGIETHSI